MAALKDKQQKEAESIKAEFAATQEKAKAEEQRAAEAKALLLEEKKRADALLRRRPRSTKGLHSNRDLKQDLAGVGQELKGVGQELKGVGENIAGVGDKIASVSNEVTSVKQDVSKVGEEVKESRKRFPTPAKSCRSRFQSGDHPTRRRSKRLFRKKIFASFRKDKPRLSEIFSKYEENKVKLIFDYSR